MPTRTEIVAKAREWLGVSFSHQGRSRAFGIDCVGLPLLVMRDLGIADFCEEYKSYSAQPIGRYVHEQCQKHLIEKPIEEIQAGDLVTLRVPTVPCHTGFIGERDGVLTLIHAYNGGPKKVIEHVLDQKWFRRIEGVFALPGV